ncbi:MAG: 6-phosphogluconolactonase [Thermoleophilia bacterium]|jgi:6-phosphogluconolactonase|nr:6-phosphogluconolactonase [Thermoleophilia bacterium]
MRVSDDAGAAARDGAGVVAAALRAAVAARGQAVLAVSGGRTPWAMLGLLAAEALPWAAVHVVQVDERVAPDGDPDRNLTGLREALTGAPLPPGNLHPMPVGAADLDAAARAYGEEVRMLSGGAPDVVHLGLGDDGHTASLVPGDPVLTVGDRWCATTGPYRGHRRMTLTYPALGAARLVLWLAVGAGKAPVLRRLLDGDPAIPAGRVAPREAVLVADRAALG